MGRKYFGKTWWGNAWVEAMERIDYNTNRLPRGRRYANNDSVKEIKVTKGDIAAKVRGTRLYRLDIKLKRFNNPELRKIEDIIAANPAIASELCLGHLPEALLEILQAGKLYLLPRDWDEIKASCSCPDWANPCKHLAAVYYILANEIDKNPFLIFNLRGMPTETLTRAAGFGAPTESPANLEKYLSKFIPSTQVEPAGESFRQPAAEPALCFGNTDINALFNLLPESPLFYGEGDFKKILYGIYKTVATEVENISIIEDFPALKKFDFYLLHKSTDKTLGAFVSPDRDLPQELKGKKAKFDVPLWTENLQKIQFCPKSGVELSRDNLFSYFLRAPLDFSVENNSPSARFLNVAAAVALSLVKSAAFIPEVFLYSQDEFGLRYVPIIQDENIKKALEYLKVIKPVNMVFREEDKTIMSADGAGEVLSQFITFIVHSLLAKKIEPAGHKIVEVFVRDTLYKVVSYQETHLAKSIADWLENLSIKKKEISPVIRVDFTQKENFKIQVDIENKSDSMSATLPLSSIFKKEEVFSRPGETVRADVSRQLIIAARYLPQLKEILNSKGEKPSIIDSAGMADILGRISGVFNILGIRMIIPRELLALAKPEICLRAKLKSPGQDISYLNLEQLLDFSWEIAIGDKSVSPEEFLKLVKSAKGLVKFKEQYLLVSGEQLKDILTKLNKPVPELSSMQIIHSALANEVDGLFFQADEALKRIIESIGEVKDVSLPDLLKGTLRPYQERGFKWLCTNMAKGFGCCLADDMGLGKTIQVIAVILKLKEENRLASPALVLCPTTVVGNWQKECNRFAPSLRTLIYHGTTRELKQAEVVITTYGILRRDLEKFRNEKWQMVIVDEAQNIKNPHTAQTKAVKSLKALSYIAMSGTPVENRLTELWSIFDFINKGYMGGLEGFKKNFALPIEKYRDPEQVQKLRRVTGPFILRRLKTDKSIINDLPEKIIYDHYCHLTKEQTAVYQQIVSGIMREINRSEGMERRGLIFKLITNLKQVCNHPAHYTAKYKLARELSGKTEKTMGLLENIISNKEKALIFTQYKEMGELLTKIIKAELDQDALFFHGSVSRGNRDLLVEKFQKDNSCKLMVVSLKAGGTGLNLTAASNVIHYDLWWNPAVEAQATDRTYRIGQTKNVVVHRLITVGTFEEKIDEMLKSKKELADLTVTSQEQWITEFSNKQLKELFSLSKQ